MARKRKVKLKKIEGEGAIVRAPLVTGDEFVA